MTDDELETTIAAARRAGSGWSSRRELQAKWAVMRRLEPRRIGAFTVLAIGCAAVVIGVVGWRAWAPIRALAGGGSAPPADSIATSMSTSGRLADGTSIVTDGPSTILRKTIEGSHDVLFELEAGGAGFEVARRPSRTFRVHAGPVTVQVIGTRFHVQRQNTSPTGVTVGVAVERGRVLVSWWGGSRELGPGENGTFPPAPANAGEPAPAAAEAPPAPEPVAPVISPATKTGGAAVAARAAPPPLAPGASSLFARADQARGAGKPAQAAVHLRQILDRYPNDPRSAMAAFTLGRLQLESLAEPRQAAAAFHRARVLANGGPLAEDALAREVQALHAAGDGGAARDRAELYRQLFPRGPRLPLVMRFGGLQAAP